MIENPIWDFGFRIFSNQFLGKKSKICFCPLSKAGGPWKEMFGLNNVVKDCKYHKCVSPNQLVQHMKSMGKDCMFHDVIYLYLNKFYKNWWNVYNKQQGNNECFDHYALFDMNSKNYSESFARLDDYGKNLPKMVNVEKRSPPKVIYNCVKVSSFIY